MARLEDIVMTDLPKELKFSMKLFKTKELLFSIQNVEEENTMKLKFESQNNSFFDKLIKRRLKVKNIVEMNLSGNQFKGQSEKYKLSWRNSTENEGEKNTIKSFEEKQRIIKEYVEIMDEETYIQVIPLEVRVFMVNFT